MKGMILAAGFGKRMLPLTLKRPKPLLEILDKPLIEYHIERLVAAKVTELVINVSHLGQQIIDTLGNGGRFGASISYSQEAEPLETAGGIVKALPQLGQQPFICISSDIWTDYSFTQWDWDTIGRLDEHVLAHLVLVDNPKHHSLGDFVLEKRDSTVLHAETAPVGPQLQLRQRVFQEGVSKLTYSGISLLNPALFAGCTESIGRLAPLLRRAMQDGRVTGEHYQGVWSDIGTPERLLQLNSQLQQAKNVR